MPTTLILFLLLGYFSYWIVKVNAAVVGSAPVADCKQFAKTYFLEFFFSLVGLAVVLVGGNEIPEQFGKISSPLTAIAVGGSIPSIAMNVFGLIFKK